MDPERQPVIVGVGRYTQRPKPLEKCLTPVNLAAYALKLAAKDTGLNEEQRNKLVTDAVGLGTTQMYLEIRWRKIFGGEPMFTNFSGSVARKLGAEIPAKYCFESMNGGNGPQYMVNRYADLISTGKIPQGPIFIGGCEENATFDRAVRAGRQEDLIELGWSDTQQGEFEKAKTMVNLHGPSLKSFSRERGKYLIQHVTHGLVVPITTYAMLENALIHSDFEEQSGLSKKEAYIDAIRNRCQMFSEFSLVAACNADYSWFVQPKRLEDIILLDDPTLPEGSEFFHKIENDKTYLKDDENRMMAFPYSKNVVARDEIDQAAFFCIMSLAEAKRRGIKDSKIVYLHGSGDCFESPLLLERERIDTSMAMQLAYNEAFRSAGLESASDIALFDIYSCFPVAVEVALRCLGLSFPSRETPVTRITQTGGLPYHGGPGSNYSSHGLCALVEKLRSDAYRGEFGMVAANGGWLTEHSIGIYSTKPPNETFQRRNYEEYALSKIEKRKAIEFAPNGFGRILTWTVDYRRNKKTGENVAAKGIIIGETVDSGKRFVANTRKGDKKTINWMLHKCRIGEIIAVQTTEEQTKAASFTTPLVAFWVDEQIGASL